MREVDRGWAGPTVAKHKAKNAGVLMTHMHGVLTAGSGFEGRSGRLRSGWVIDALPCRLWPTRHLLLALTLEIV